MASRLEALIRLADAIRSERNPRDLLPRFAGELQQVIPFDAVAQASLSSAASWFLLRDGTVEPLPRLGSPEQETLEQSVFRKSDAAGCRFLARTAVGNWNALRLCFAAGRRR